jgi:hypothetical protein
MASAVLIAAVAVVGACGDDDEDVPAGGSETPATASTTIGPSSGNTISPPDLSTSSTRT